MSLSYIDPRDDHGFGWFLISRFGRSVSEAYNRVWISLRGKASDDSILIKMMMSGLHCSVYTAYTDYPVQLKSSAGIRPIVTCGPSLDSGRKLGKMQGNYSLFRTLLYWVRTMKFERQTTLHHTSKPRKPPENSNGVRLLRTGRKIKTKKEHQTDLT